MTFFDLLKHNIVLMLMHFLKIKKYEKCLEQACYWKLNTKVFI
jgi:hypothetical protein